MPQQEEKKLLLHPATWLHPKHYTEQKVGANQPKLHSSIPEAREQAELTSGDRIRTVGPPGEERRMQTGKETRGFLGC